MSDLLTPEDDDHEPTAREINEYLAERILFHTPTDGVGDRREIENRAVNDAIEKFGDSEFLALQAKRRYLGKKAYEAGRNLARRGLWKLRNPQQLSMFDVDEAIIKLDNDRQVILGAVTAEHLDILIRLIDDQIKAFNEAMGGTRDNSIRFRQIMEDESIANFRDLFLAHPELFGQATGLDGNDYSDDEFDEFDDPDA